MKKDLNVLYQSNDAFAPYLGVSLYSLLKNNTDIENLHVYIINIGIEKVNMEKVETMCAEFGREITWIDSAAIQKAILDSGMPEYKGFRKNTMSLMKVFAADFIEARHVLYIDCDTIITGSLNDLVGLDIGECSLGMVLDSIIPPQYKIDIGLRSDSNYYNSGIIYYDFENWKKNRCVQRIVDFANTGKVFGTVDQDYLSVVLNKDVYTLDLKYNVQCIHLLSSPKGFMNTFADVKPFYSKNEVEAAVQNPAIIHYEKFCSMSPWHKDSVHPSTALFDSYLKESPWADYVKQPAPSKGIMFEVEKILYKIFPGDVFIKFFRIASNRMLINSNRK